MIGEVYRKYLNIKNDILYEPDADTMCQKSLGIMAFMKMSYDGIDLQPLQKMLEQEILKNPHNAAALLDSGSLMFIKGTNAEGALWFTKGNNAYALQRQQAALKQIIFFKTRQLSSPALRVLILAAPGEITCNTPIEFLLQNDAIDVTFWYVLPDGPKIQSIPEHDIAIVTAAISEATKPSTRRIQKMVQNWPRPVINRIENIEKFSRDRLYTYVKGIPGIFMPETKTILRSDITEQRMPFSYPFIIRPTNSFGGHRLSKIENAADLSKYLSSYHEAEFFVSPFIDYSSEDGLFRKYRIAVIDGKAFPFHMAISEKWAIWYYKAGMLSDEEKIAEETTFLVRFDKEGGLGYKYGAALKQLSKKIGAEYFVLDCAETKTGELLIFEGGHDMVVHDMDSPQRFPEKNEQTRELFCAFQMMLKAKSGSKATRQ